VSDDCLEAFVAPWWVSDDGQALVRGRLIRVHVPHVVGEQAWLEVEGRAGPSEHTKARYVVRTDSRFGDVKKLAKLTHAALPAAALPAFPGETLLVQRARLRWALVVYAEPSSTLLVAPVYAVDEGPAPAPELLRDIRRCAFASTLFVSIPGEKHDSIVRFDQLQPVAAVPGNYQITRHRLSDDALGVVDDWLVWLLVGAPPAGSMLAVLRDGLGALPV